MTMMMIPKGYPDDVHAPLARLVEKLIGVEPSVRAVVVYGSLAKGTWRAGESDINVLVVVQEASATVIERIAPVLRASWREALVRPMILAAAEVARVGDVFPIKLRDMQRYHDVIHGEDPFAGIELRSDHLRLRVEQQLRNHVLQLRRHLVLAVDNDRELVRTLMTAARSLPIELGALLHLKGVNDVGSTLEDLADVAARELDISADALRTLAAFKHRASNADVHHLYRDVMSVVARAVEIADTLEPM